MSENAIGLAIESLRATSGKRIAFEAFALELAQWFMIFDREFALRLPQMPVVTFGNLTGANACYVHSRGILGAIDQVTFSIDGLDREPDAVLATALHEMLHCLRAYQGASQDPSGDPHDEAFRAVAERCGLIVTPEGCTSAYTRVFSRVLEKYPETYRALADALQHIVRARGGDQVPQGMRLTT